MNLLDINFSRSSVGVTSMGRIKNENERRRSLIERERKRARKITESEQRSECMCRSKWNAGAGITGSRAIEVFFIAEG